MALPLPFFGQIRCSICDILVQGPEFAGGWRAVDADFHVRFYACRGCCPDEEANPLVWRDFYIRIAEHLHLLNHRKPLKRLVIWRERAGQAELLQS